MTDADNGSKTIEEARAKYKKAEADLKAAGKDVIKRKLALDARKAAGAEIDAFKQIENPNYAMEQFDRNNKNWEASKKKLAAARNKYRDLDVKIKAISIVVQVGRLNEDVLNKNWKKLYPNDPKTFTKDDINKLYEEYNKLPKDQRSWNKVSDALKAQRKEQGNIIKRERDVNIPKYKRNAELLKNVSGNVGAVRKRVEREQQGGGSGGGSGGDSGGGSNEGEERTSVQEFKDKDGNVVVATKDKNGNVLSYQFKDKEGKVQTLKADEIKKANVSMDDVKKALENGDLAKALEMLLEALATKNNNYQPVVQQPSTKEYKDGDKATFRVDKLGDKITSVTFMENGMAEPLKLSPEQFAKAGIDPKKIEEYLDKKDYKSAALAILDTADKNNIFIRRKEEVKVSLNGNNIILKDQFGKQFELSESYLVSKGVKASKAKGTMKKFREAMSVNPMPKGMEQAIAAYFRGENPSPSVPAQRNGQWRVEKLNKTWLDTGVSTVGGSSKTTSITVKDAQGNVKKLKGEDFANYFGCSEKDGKKILKAYARAIEDGADLSGIIGEIADRSSGSKSKSMVIGQLGKAAQSIGGSAVGQVTDKTQTAINRKISDFTSGIFRD